MAQRIVVYWRDIPAQILVRSGRRTARRELPQRFQQAIDRAAMRAGVVGADAYLAEWRRGEPEACGEDLEAEAERALEALLEAYDEARLQRLVRNGGRDPERC